MSYILDNSTPLSDPAGIREQVTIGQHVLYRFFDEAGALLYVGVTNNPRTRFRDHRAYSPWWHKSTTITLTRFKSRTELEAAELTAIRTEHPKYNRAHVEHSAVQSVRIGERSQASSAFGPDGSTFPPPDAIACD